MLNQEKTVDLATSIVDMIVTAQKEQGLTVVECLVAITTVRSQMLDYCIKMDAKNGYALFDFLLEQERATLLSNHGNVQA